MSAATVGGFAALAVCGVTVLLAVVRLVRGPSVADRVVALDLLSAVAVGIMAAWAVAADDAVYLDVALLVALLAFLGTVAFAAYAEGGGLRVTAATLLVLGAAFMLLAGVGLLRLPDLFLRMSATAKAATLGAALTALGAAAHFGDAAITGRVLVIVVFLLLTAPVAAHKIGRAGYRRGRPALRGHDLPRSEGPATPARSGPRVGCHPPRAASSLRLATPPQQRVPRSQVELRYDSIRYLHCPNRLAVR